MYFTLSKLLNGCSDPTITAAERWSKELWTKSARQWSLRKQDLTYRDHVSWYGWRKLFDDFAEHYPTKKIHVLDSGAGDLSETVLFTEALTTRSFSGILTAFEPQPKLASIGELRCNLDWKPTRGSFFHHVITRLPKFFLIKKKAHLLLSSYVLHDVADIEGYVRKNARLLREGGWAGFMIVHPDFVEAMIQKGAVREHAEINGPGSNWITTLEYPIVERTGTFYVPLFHRSVSFYQKLLLKHFSHVEPFSLRVPKEDAGQLARSGDPPFCTFRCNPYYPEIVEMDSSLLFICKK